MLSRFFFSLALFSFLFPTLLLTPQPASAAAWGLVPCALQNDNPATNWDDRAPCTLCHFLIGMNFVVKLLRNVMTAIAIAVMVAMAIMYIVSAGNEDMMATAKKGILASLIGIVVILLAWVIVNFIFTLPIFANNGLVKQDGSWDTFTCNTTSQAGWTGTRNTSGISNGTGSTGGNQPGREGLPGTVPNPDPTRTCPNGSCGSGESCATCPVDCGVCPSSTCGNGTCGSGENCSTCPADCGTCPGDNGNGGGGGNTAACSAGRYTWTGPQGASCSARYPVLADEEIKALEDDEDPYVGDASIVCRNSMVYGHQPLSAHCGTGTTSGDQACGVLTMSKNSAGEWSVFATCNQGTARTVNCDHVDSSGAACTWNCVNLAGTVLGNCSGTANPPE